MKCWWKLTKPRKTWFRPVLHFFNFLVFLLNTLKIDILEGPVTQIPLFSIRNCYREWVILNLLTLSSLFIIEFFDDLVRLALGLAVSNTTIYQPISHHHLKPHCFQPYPPIMTSSLIIWLGALWAKECMVEIGGSFLSLGWKIDWNQ